MHDGVSINYPPRLTAHLGGLGLVIQHPDDDDTLCSRKDVPDDLYVTFRVNQSTLPEASVCNWLSAPGPRKYSGGLPITLVRSSRIFRG